MIEWSTPNEDGTYWWRSHRDDTPDAVLVRGDFMYDFADTEPTSVSLGEFLGPISPSDAEQLMELRREALKGICVYCGEIQQYESLEQKSGEDGNRIRVEHIRQCPQRPELRLIAYCEELQEAANAAFKCLCGTGDKTIDQVKDQLFAALNPDLPKETQ